MSIRKIDSLAYLVVIFVPFKKEFSGPPILLKNLNKLLVLIGPKISSNALMKSILTIEPFDIKDFEFDLLG